MAGAQVSSLLVNLNRAKGAEVRSISDFMIVERMIRKSYITSEDDRVHDLMKRVIIGLGGKVS